MGNAYPRRGLETSREQRRAKAKPDDEEQAFQPLRVAVSSGIKRFYADRGLESVSGQWRGQCPKDKIRSEVVSILPDQPQKREAPLTKWVSKRQTSEPLPPRYVPTMKEGERLNLITNARKIIEDAERKGLVTRSTRIHQPNGGAA
jgi:hypothetical protein